MTRIDDNKFFVQSRRGRSALVSFLRFSRGRMMKNPWQKLLIKTIIWIAGEIFLNWLGLDNLADYSEFIFQARGSVQISKIKASLVVFETSKSNFFGAVAV